MPVLGSGPNGWTVSARAALVVSDEDGEHIAGPDTTLSPGRHFVVAVEPDVVDEVMNLMRS